jgi:hypothetical protein
MNGKSGRPLFDALAGRACRARAADGSACPIDEPVDEATGVEAAVASGGVVRESSTSEARARVSKAVEPCSLEDGLGASSRA